MIAIANNNHVPDSMPTVANKNLDIHYFSNLFEVTLLVNVGTRESKHLVLELSSSAQRSGVLHLQQSYSG